MQFSTDKIRQVKTDTYNLTNCEKFRFNFTTTGLNGIRTIRFLKSRNLNTILPSPTLRIKLRNWIFYLT
jgi:hypothetical protein